MRSDRRILLDKRKAEIALPPPGAVKCRSKMLAEYLETDPLFIGPDRLGRMCGRSGRWIRHRESEGVIERAILNGEGPPGRPVYDADQTLPKLVAFLAARKGPSLEAQQLAKQRVEAGRLKLEAARLELDKLTGTVMPTAEAKAVFGDLVVHCRQRLLHLPGAVKRTLGLSMEQMLGLQKEIRAVLTDLSQGKAAADPGRGKPAPAGRCRRSKRQVKRG